MGCYRPNKAVQGHYLNGHDTNTGEVREFAKPILWWPDSVASDGARSWCSLEDLRSRRRYKSYMDSFAVHREIYLPCGKCHGCRLVNVRQWSLRMMHQARYSAPNWFITLTYDDKHMPQFGNLQYDHLSKFFKRCRRDFQTPEKPFKYFAVGEYGDRTLRPHYHYAAFDFKISDLRPFKQTKNGWYFTSELLREKWPYGHHIVAPLTWNTACYVAGYVTKKMHGDDIRKIPQPYEVVRELLDEGLDPSDYIEHYTIQRAFQSHGLGVPFYRDHWREIWDLDGCLFKGKYMVQPPRYYYKMLQRDNPDLAEDVAYRRQQRYLDRPALDEKLDRELLYALQVKDLEMQTYVRSL